MNRHFTLRPENPNRLWWLLALLLGLLNLVAWQRDRVVRITDAMAKSHLAARQPESARWWLDLSQRISKVSPQTEFLLGRLARREGNMDAARRHLRRARYLGFPPDQLEREEWMATAQTGQMYSAAAQLPRLLEEGEEDGAEICEAYLIGYLRFRDFSSALTLLGAWKEAYPDDPQPLAWAGQIHRELQANEEAERELRRALEIDPRHPTAALGLGELLVDTKRIAEAVPYLRIASEDPALRSQASVGLARALRSLSQSDEARLVLEEALQHDPDSSQLLVEEAALEIEIGDYEEAEAILRPLVDAGSRQREVRHAYATALRGLNRVEEAAGHFDYAAEAARQSDKASQLTAKVSERPQDAQLRFEIGDLYLKYGHTADGLIWLHSALEVQPAHRDAHRALADYYQSRIGSGPRYLGLYQRHRALAGPSPEQPPASESAKIDSSSPHSGDEVQLGSE